MFSWLGLERAECPQRYLDTLCTLHVAGGSMPVAPPIVTRNKWLAQHKMPQTHVKVPGALGGGGGMAKVASILGGNSLAKSMAWRSAGQRR